MIKQLLSNIYSKLINLIMDVHGVNMNQFMFQTIHPAKDYTIISNSPWKDLITFHMAPKITTNHVEDMDADEDDAMEVVTTLWVESNFEFAPRILGTRGHKFFQFLLANT